MLRVMIIICDQKVRGYQIWSVNNFGDRILRLNLGLHRKLKMKLSIACKEQKCS